MTAPVNPPSPRVPRFLAASACILLLILGAGCTSTQAPAPVTPAPVTTPAAVQAAGTTAPAPPPVATVLPSGNKFQYDDNFGKQIVSVSLRNAKVRSHYYYYYNDVSNPVTLRHDAPGGTQLLLVGVTFDLVGLHGSGSRTRFMTPLASSFALWDGGSFRDPVDPHTLDNPLHYYIKDEGSLYLDRWIEKDQPGTGILVYEVPPSFAVKGSYLRFCPGNDPSWASRGIAPRSPDTWNCARDGVAWKLG